MHYTNKFTRFLKNNKFGAFATHMCTVYFYYSKLNCYKLNFKKNSYLIGIFIVFFYRGLIYPRSFS
jgi:hypothetical protein